MPWGPRVGGHGGIFCAGRPPTVFLGCTNNEFVVVGFRGHLFILKEGVLYKGYKGVLDNVVEDYFFLFLLYLVGGKDGLVRRFKGGIGGSFNDVIGYYSVLGYSLSIKGGRRDGKDCNGTNSTTTTRGLFVYLKKRVKATQDGTMDRLERQGCYGTTIGVRQFASCYTCVSRVFCLFSYYFRGSYY